MLSSRKKPKAMRPSEILPKWFSLQRSESLVDEAEVAKAQKLSDDPTQFFKQVVGFEPTPYQREFIHLFLENQFLAARWCRQGGKSWIVSALLLWYAVTHPDSYIAVVGPSWRQAKLIIRRIAHFVRNLPPGMCFKPLRTAVRFTNGSVVEAFPNNPETIRGPTLHIVYADEFNFIANDEEMYDAILFTLGTTNGKFVCTSTPWTTDSIFYKIFHNPAYEDFGKSHITYKDALEPGGPLKVAMVEKIRKQFEGDPWRWGREMMAEWAEDESVWLPQALISSCIDHELEYFGFEDQAKGVFCGGLDLGKHHDHSIFAIVMLKDDLTKLVHIHKFPLKTPYATVIGYVKTLRDRWKHLRKVLVDMSGVGDYIVEDMINAGIRETEGVKFTQQAKQQLAIHLKQSMIQGKFKIPYDPKVIAELNIERFELTKDGAIKFSHPESTHDDRFWAIAQAVYAARKREPEPYFGVVPK